MCKLVDRLYSSLQAAIDEDHAAVLQVMESQVPRSQTLEARQQRKTSHVKKAMHHESSALKHLLGQQVLGKTSVVAAGRGADVQQLTTEMEDVRLLYDKSRDESNAEWSLAAQFT
jgi:hypothetical protein